MWLPHGMLFEALPAQEMARRGVALAEQDLSSEIRNCPRSQGTKWWELRAATSLAGLLAQQDRRGEARTMLAQIYNWFTQGFDTADLKDAKALLDELSDRED